MGFFHSAHLAVMEQVGLGVYLLADSRQATLAG